MTNANSQSHAKPHQQWHYAVYGLRLVSDHSISGLIPLESNPGKHNELSVRFGPNGADAVEQDSQEETLWYTSDILDARGNPALKIWKGKLQGDYRIRYSHGLAFHVNPGLTSISVHGDASISEEEIAALLLGPVLGIILRLRGVTSLHASAVSVGGRAIAFVGVEGAGKSTAAALFAQNGHAVLSDDIVALIKRDQSFQVLPAYPYLNLWPQSLEMISGLPIPSSAPPEGEKYQVRLGAGDLRFQREALPLAAIYLLGERSGEPRAPFIEQPAPQDALMSLVANTYGNKLLDAAMRAQEFSVLGQLVNLLPIRRVVAHQDPAQLSKLHKLICEDVSHRRL